MSQPVDITVAPPTPKAPFLPSERFRIRRVGQTDDNPGGGLTVYAFFDVMEELLFASDYLPTQTTAGVLTGGYYTGPAGEFVEIRGFRDGGLIESTLEFSEIVRRDWGRLHQDQALIEAGLRPLGWFLSCPGSGAKLGPFEHIVHGSYFNLPFHLLLMLDPEARVAGLYANGPQEGGDGRLRNVGFNLIESITLDPQNEEQDLGDHSTDST